MTPESIEKAAPPSQYPVGLIPLQRSHDRAFYSKSAAFISTVATSTPARLLLLILITGIQVALAGVCFYLIDLTVSLMEVWAELARKHLEITL